MVFLLILEFDLLLALITVLCVIPASILLINYLKTSLIDYLLFSMIFFSLTVTSISVNFGTGTNILFLSQLAQWSLNLTIFSAFIHGLNIKRQKATKILKIVGFSWFAILQILVFFFKSIVEPGTTYIFYKCLEITRITDFPSDHIGEGIMTSEGYMIYSSGFPLISTLFQLFVVITVLYSYIKLKPILQTKQVKNINLTMILVWILFLISIITDLPWINGINPEMITSLGDFCLLSALFLIAFISIRFPELLLISHIQILKARHLFIKLKEDSRNVFEKKKILYFNEDSFTDYLNAIPSEFYNHITEDN